MATPDSSDPKGGARNVGFTSDLSQCDTSTITWQGGLSPVRVEFYQQDNDTAMWQTITDGMFNVEYDSNSNVTHTLDWVVNVEAKKNVWAVIVDHSGAFSQHRQPYQVGPGEHSGCLLSSRLEDSASTAKSTKTLSAVSAGLMGALFAALFAVAGLIFWVISLRRRLAREQQKVKHLSTAPSPSASLLGMGATAAAGGLYRNASSKRTGSMRSRSADSVRSMQQLHDPFSTSLDGGARYDDLYDEAQGGTWNSASHQTNPFSDQYATLGSEAYVASGSSDQNGASTYNTATHLLHGQYGSRPQSNFTSDDMQMAERQSIRSEPSLAAHSIATEATLASSSSQSDATTINSERDRLGADLSRTPSGTGTSTSSHDSAPQFFKISVNPAQLMRDSRKDRKVS